MKKGNKPDFHQSANGEKAKTLYQAFYNKVGALYEPGKVKDGVFAAMMDVALVNDGPVTIQIDTNPPKMDDTSPGGSVPNAVT
jgi:D-tyrosyl-tRNA(Tyr) deacylase